MAHDRGGWQGLRRGHGAAFRRTGTALGTYQTVTGAADLLLQPDRRAALGRDRAGRSFLLRRRSGICRNSDVAAGAEGALIAAVPAAVSGCPAVSGPLASICARRVYIMSRFITYRLREVDGGNGNRKEKGTGRVRAEFRNIRKAAGRQKPARPSSSTRTPGSRRMRSPAPSSWRASASRCFP